MLVHAATENMAALLRSARLLQYKPSCLLHISVPKSSGVPLSRLYSRAAGGRRLGQCTRQLFPALDNAPSRLLPYTSVFVHNYSVVVELLDGSGASKNDFQFDWALTRLNQRVKKSGRIAKYEILDIFKSTCADGNPSSNQALLLLRSCGSVLAEVLPAERTQLAHDIWEKLQELGVQYENRHYNALLKVYLQNEFKFSPTDFLAKMEAANVVPDRVTYQRLIAAYCEDGNIDGASKILAFMKSKNLPITEDVFNSLITGHACTGDFESAKNMFEVMRNAGIEPSSDTFVALLNAYAKNGDMTNVEATLDAARKADCILMNRDLMQVALTLARAGHHQHVPQIMEHMRTEKGYIQETMYLCFNLITHGHADTALLFVKSLPSFEMNSVSIALKPQGNFFLRHCVNMNLPVEKIIQYCTELEESNLHSCPFDSALRCALEAKNTDMSYALMRAMKDRDMPVRPHYFWPLLTVHLKDKNLDAVMEILKSMASFDVAPDANTIITFVYPLFSSIHEALQTMRDAGINMNINEPVHPEVRELARTNLSCLYTFLTGHSIAKPRSNLFNFRRNLIEGFKTSSDVESMVKITDLMFKDPSVFKEGQAPYFLYNLINSMTVSELQEQRDKLKKYFRQLHEKNITISDNIFRGIRKCLHLSNAPELIKYVDALVDPTDVQPVDHSKEIPNKADKKFDLATLEKELRENESKTEPMSRTLKRVFMGATTVKDVERALELQLTHNDEMDSAAYAILISLCASHDMHEVALELKREMCRKNPSAFLDIKRSILLVRTLGRNGRIQEAADILKEIKENNLVLNDYHLREITVTLNAVGAKGGAAAVRSLLDTLFTLGLTKPSTALCATLIDVYMNGDDLPGALNATIECLRRYGIFPRIHSLIVAMVEQGDTEQLQKAIDFVNDQYGEMTMYFDLFFAFLEAGRYQEARRIIETPGLKAHPRRMKWFAERCVWGKKVECLEQLIEMTHCLDCDRDELYKHLLKLYDETNEWQKAEATWKQMQEECLIPKEQTLRLLADILKRNGQDVSFLQLQSLYQDPASITIEVDKEKDLQMTSLCKEGKVEEAFELMEKFNEEEVILSSKTYNHLVRRLWQADSLEKAMAVNNMAVKHIPDFQLSTKTRIVGFYGQCKLGNVEAALATLKSLLLDDIALTRFQVEKLLKAQAMKGDVSGILELERVLEPVKSEVDVHVMTFPESKALAYIHNGDFDSAMELMESICTNPETQSSRMNYLFHSVITSGNKEALDKVSAMVERLGHQFACYGPATDFFIELIMKGKANEAKFMAERCGFLAEQREKLCRWFLTKSRRSGQVDKLKNMMRVVPDFMGKGMQYSYLMRAIAMNKDLKSGNALLEQMRNEGMEPPELALKWLTKLYKEVGQTPPFDDPPETVKFYSIKIREEAFPETQKTEE